MPHHQCSESNSTFDVYSKLKIVVDKSSSQSRYIEAIDRPPLSPPLSPSAPIALAILPFKLPTRFHSESRESSEEEKLLILIRRAS